MGRNKQKAREEAEKKRKIEIEEINKTNKIMEKIEEINETLSEINDMSILIDINTYVWKKKNLSHLTTIKRIKEKEDNARRQKAIEEKVDNKRRRESSIESNKRGAELANNLESLEIIENMEILEDLGAESIKDTLIKWKSELINKEKLRDMSLERVNEILNSSVENWDSRKLADCNGLITEFHVHSLNLNFKLGEFYHYLNEQRGDIDLAHFLSELKAKQTFKNLHGKTQANNYRRLFDTLGKYKRIKLLPISMNKLMPLISRILEFFKTNDFEEKWWSKE